ncbi:MAG: hypothetical protein QXU40_00925 [Candidatus Pacearchaeota archaeon]
MKRGVIIISFLLLFFFIIFLIYPEDLTSILNFMTGKSIVGVTKLLIEGIFSVKIDSPENKTYYFNIGENYTLDLNVSSFFEIESWWYSLYDLKHNQTVVQNLSFTPNTTFDAVRWSNKIVVYANNSKGDIASDSVVFFVSVPNSAPILGDIPDHFFACEKRAFSYIFNASDPDEDDLVVDLFPKDPFFVFPTQFFGETFIESELFSGILKKENIGNHTLEISVSDGNYSDSTNTTIEVIEINNQPSIGDIGVKTVWTRGENSTLEYQVNASDIEDGNYTSGNLTFNVSFSNNASLFDINGTGFINYTGKENDVGVYNVSVCVTDKGIENIHSNISFCNETGAPKTTCKNFSLTVTNQNRPPTIKSWYPTNLNFSINGTDNIYFNITTYDPDFTIPDTYWYVDGVLKKYTFGKGSDEFSYTFGCGVAGEKNISVEITDGLLNDSIIWNVSVMPIPCPLPTAGGGGGAAVVKACSEKWACREWSVCQNLESSFKEGYIFGEDYRRMRSECESYYKWDAKSCGFQIRGCKDINNCNTSFFLPAIMRVCYFSLAPSCKDGIKNCHDNGCEVGIDCGGPCPPCPSCSDGIKNQGEFGIDCGGPCPYLCPPERPLIKFNMLFWFIVFILLLLFLILLLKIIDIIRLKRHLKRISV